LNVYNKYKDFFYVGFQGIPPITSHPQTEEREVEERAAALESARNRLKITTAIYR